MNPLRHHSDSTHDSTRTGKVGRLVGYVLGTIVLTTLATVACGTNDDQHRRPVQSLTSIVPTSGVGGAWQTRVRRQSFSMIQDLDALAEMLREAVQRRRMQTALDFFNGLRKRDEKRASPATTTIDNGSHSADEYLTPSSQIGERLLADMVAMAAYANTGHKDTGIVRERPLLEAISGGK